MKDESSGTCNVRKFSIGAGDVTFQCINDVTLLLKLLTVLRLVLFQLHNRSLQGRDVTNRLLNYHLQLRWLQQLFL